MSRTEMKTADESAGRFVEHRAAYFGCGITRR